MDRPVLESCLDHTLVGDSPANKLEDEPKAAQTSVVEDNPVDLPDF